MRKILTVIPALAVAMAAIATAQAAPRGGNTAALATPLAAPKQEIVSGVLWKCAGEHCAASSDGSRPLLVCQRVAKTFGPVARFTTPTGELSSEELSRCNGPS
ncbi:MAG: hypothetical protein JF595_03665 [Sphingomonadales bacterium]|nr:hypothetical protein [Sphingomonadales bacterium]